MMTWQVDGDRAAACSGQSLQRADAEPVLRGETNAVEEQNGQLRVSCGRLALSVEQRRVAALQLHGSLGQVNSGHPEQQQEEEEVIYGIVNTERCHQI